MRRFVCIWMIASGLGGCAITPTSTTSSAPVAFTDTPFALDGRISATREREGITASFTWVHAPPRDELTVSTPLGQTIAEIVGDANARRVTLTRSDGTHEQASDWASLTERALGFALPVEGLAAWARGAPHSRSAFSREVDAAGRTSLLRQDGWEITYDYADDASREPKRVRLAYPGLDVRIAADRWRPA